MASPIGTLEDLQRFLENPEDSEIYWLLNRSTPYPVYGVLLYAPTNGSNEQLREYVRNYFPDLFERTGPNWLLVVFESLPYAPIPNFQPEAVYEIAGFLGAEHTDLPCIVFFTDPKERSDTLVVGLSELLGNPYDVDELFGKFASIVNSCRDEPVDRRLSCLSLRIERELPRASGWRTKLSGALSESTFGALTTIVNLFRTA